MNKRVLYIPHGGIPVFTRGIPEDFQCDDTLSISGNLSMLYSITHSSPNPYLAKYGYILTNIPGNAVIVYEKNDKECDIPLNIIEKLPEIIKKDADARVSFVTNLKQFGNVVII